MLRCPILTITTTTTTTTTTTRKTVVGHTASLTLSAACPITAGGCVTSPCCVTGCVTGCVTFISIRYESRPHVSLNQQAVVIDHAVIVLINIFKHFILLWLLPPAA
jgi:hypothetical protein